MKWLTGARAGQSATLDEIETTAGSNCDRAPYSRMGAPRVRISSAVAAAGIAAIAIEPALTKERLVSRAPGTFSIVVIVLPFRSSNRSLLDPFG